MAVGFAQTSTLTRAVPTYSDRKGNQYMNETSKALLQQEQKIESEIETHPLSALSSEKLNHLAASGDEQAKDLIALHWRSNIIGDLIDADYMDAAESSGYFNAAHGN
jgi:hypothetical protein